MTQFPPPICLSCKHWHDKGIFQCDAYPDRIPDEILESAVDHHKPYKGDHGIQYESIKGK